MISAADLMILAASKTALLSRHVIVIKLFCFEQGRKIELDIARGMDESGQGTSLGALTQVL